MCLRILMEQHFNSQPHKEADLNPVSIPLFMAYFNSQPHKEADQAIPSVRQMFQHFNSQPHKEADHTRWGMSVWGGLYFNSQPHKEADIFLFYHFISFHIFQLTASQGG